jgi:dTDP-4-dehydrorhamnose reductase
MHARIFLSSEAAWIYGAEKQNFIHKLRSWTRNSEYLNLNIACDEFSVPTCADTIVNITLRERHSHHE